MTIYPTMPSQRKVRFALAGCGRIAGNHFAALERHSDTCELAGVCDPDPRALEEAAYRTGARPYRNLAGMLDDCQADAIILTTPSGLHSSQTIEVAHAGRHVITEKPMATRWEDGKRMVAACDEARVRLFVVKQNRLNATMQILKKAIDGKRFGRIHMMNMNVFWTRPQAYYDSAGWRGTWEYDGGAFMNQASHYIDLAQWLIGPVQSLHAYAATLERDIEVEDTGVINLQWRNGALGSINVTMLAYPKNFEGSITILGDKGTVRIGGVALNEVQHWEFAEPNDDDRRVRESSYATDSVYGFGHAQYYENVIKVMRGEANPETDGRQGLKTLEILVAAYRSACEGKRIALPLEH